MENLVLGYDDNFSKTDVVQKLNSFSSHDQNSFFSSFAKPNEKAISIFLSDIKDCVEYYDIDLDAN